MEQFELTETRLAIGWDLETTARILQVSRERLADWESGRRLVPSKYAKKLRHMRGLAERSAALQRSGLPQCSWMEGWNAREWPEEDDEAFLASLAECEDHEATCEVCAARARFVAERFPPLKEPYKNRPTSWLFSKFYDVIQRLPRWLQPIVLGASLAGFVLLPLTLASPLAVLAAGASAGATYSTLRRVAWKPLAMGFAGAVGAVALVALDSDWTIRQLVTTMGGWYILGAAFTIPLVESWGQRKR